MRVKKSFTLIEILVVIVIIGILVTLALPNYSRIQEKALDREARATLVLMRAAERIYKMEYGNYFISGVISDINSYLKLSLPTAASPKWDYSVTDTATGTIQGTRLGGIRTWELISSTASEEPGCTGTCL